MSTLGLQGNQETAKRIREAAGRDALTHALLFTGPGDRLAAARFAAAALECVSEQDRPCGVCSGCRKVLEGIHPDVTVVRDDEHKMVSVDVIRAARSDVYIRPNEGNCKVYVFPDCTLLTEQDQNVLLKIVEEGPPYAAFCFCAENSAVVLPTLRSRCVEIKLRPEQERSGDAIELSEAAEALCRKIGEKKHTGVVEVLVRQEKRRITREELQTLLAQARACFAAALLAVYGRQPQGAGRETALFLAKNLTKTQLLHTIELLQSVWQECSYNVAPGQVLGALAVELEGIL